MNNQENLDDDVMNILAILQQTPTAQAEPQKAEKKAMPLKSDKGTTKDPPSVKTTFSSEKAKTQILKPEAQSSKTKNQSSKLDNHFMSAINEPEDKSIFNSKVLIREEIYEIFMSLKRVKKFKSVSTLIDFALEEYIKNHKEEIKQTLFDSKKQGIL
jgi:hypothetical protein